MSIDWATARWRPHQWKWNWRLSRGVIVSVQLADGSFWFSVVVVDDVVVVVWWWLFWLRMWWKERGKGGNG